MSKSKRLVLNEADDVKSKIPAWAWPVILEWIVEARNEGYTWKQIASHFGVSVSTLRKKFFGVKMLKP